MIQQARARFGQAPSVVLRADQPTGEKPWEMFVTDEHTATAEHDRKASRNPCHWRDMS